MIVEDIQWIDPLLEFRPVVEQAIALPY